MGANESIFNFDMRTITDEYFGNIFFSAPNMSEGEYGDLSKAIQFAIELDERPVFLEGVVLRLNQLGIACSEDDIELIRKEVSKRLKERCGLVGDQTKNYRNWINGKSTPSTEKRRDLYTLCYALEMDFRETAEFFAKYYLTLPYNYKDTIDAIFLYALKNQKSFEYILSMLEQAETFEILANDGDNTEYIGRHIIEIDDDAEFERYLSQHCFNKQQMFSRAKNEINSLIEIIKEKGYLEERGAKIENVVRKPIENNSELIEFLTGINYQRAHKEHELDEAKQKILPERFLSSLPNDVSIAKIDESSYESIRKTLIILKFYDFYFGREIPAEDILDELYDFQEEIEKSLALCGLANIYFRHPFDCLIFYCANSLAPIDLFRELYSLKYDIDI